MRPIAPKLKTVVAPTQDVPEQPRTITLPVQLVDAVLNYLSDRPYREVAGLVSAILLSVKNKSASPASVPTDTPVPQSTEQENVSDEIGPDQR